MGRIVITGLVGLSLAQICGAQDRDPLPATELPTTKLPATELPNPGLPAPEITQAGQTYTPAFFDQFQPQTAAEMVARIPGFVIVDTDGGERGFGQADLNIVINGRRPSSKSSSARDILGQIPAGTVTRIEVVDGTTLGIPGLTGEVANIFTAQTGLSGSWEYAARFEEGTQPQLQELEFSLAGARGNVDYTLKLESEVFRQTQDGPEFFADGDGVVFEDRREDIQLTLQRPSLDVNLTWERDNGHVGNANIVASTFNRTSANFESFTALDARGRTGLSNSTGGEDEIEYELSGDYAFPLRLFGAGGTLKLIGLHRFEDSDFTSAFEDFPIVDGAAVPSVFTFDQEVLEAEYIARAEYSWLDGQKRDWQFSVEGAFNSLEQDAFLNRQALGVRRVEEVRAETNLTHSRNIGPWAVQASIGGEYSRLDVPTSTSEDRQFVRPKGFIAADRDIGPDWGLFLRAERTVGQLNFFDFIDGVNLSDDIANSGNDQIVPEQTTRGEVRLERRDTSGVSGALTLFAERIDDPIDRIRFDDGTEGPGNLDSAELYGAEANLTWVLDGYGWRGARIDLEGAVADSAIDDPILDKSRRINDTLLWSYEIELRWDIPSTDIAINAELEQSRQSEFFRLDQIFDLRIPKPSLFTGIEHKALLGMKWELGVQNLLDAPLIREREIFAPDRAGDRTGLEEFRRRSGRRLVFKLSDTF